MATDLPNTLHPFHTDFQGHKFLHQMRKKAPESGAIASQTALLPIALPHSSHARYPGLRSLGFKSGPFSGSSKPTHRRRRCLTDAQLLTVGKPSIPVSCPVPPSQVWNVSPGRGVVSAPAQTQASSGVLQGSTLTPCRIFWGALKETNIQAPLLDPLDVVPWDFKSSF